MGDQTPDARVRTYADVMKDQQLAREKDNTLAVCSDAFLSVARLAPHALTPAPSMGNYVVFVAARARSRLGPPKVRLALQL